MDPIRLLKKQHREVEDIFRQVEKAKDPKKARELVARLLGKLTPHMQVEEQVFYPAVRDIDTKKAEEMVLEGIEEHSVIRLILAELPEADPEHERFHPRMTVLSEFVEHHVEEEEKEMFKLAGRLGDERLQELGERMSAAFERHAMREEELSPVAGKRRARAA